MAVLCNASPAVATAAEGDAERGRRLIAQYQCGSCHTIPGVPSAGGQRAPSLKSFGLRSYIAGRVANRPELLARWIVQPQSLVPGTPMPAMGVAPADARDIAAYLLQLR
jgi:cytochrome c